MRTVTNEPISKTKAVSSADSDVTFCIACRGELSYLGMHNGFTHATCRKCKTVQIAPLPQAEAVEAYYRESNFSTEQHENTDPDGIRASSAPYYASLEKVLSDYRVTGTVIDFGAGWGGFTEFLVKRGYKVRGIELSKNQVLDCQRRGLPVEQRSLDSLASSGVKAQALVLSGVFEHLAKPEEFFQHAQAALEDGGLFISLQPTAPFAQLLADWTRLGAKEKPLPSSFGIFDAPWHVALYSLDGMKQLAIEHGFDLLEIRPAPQGRVKGLYGAIQISAEIVNRFGWALFKTAWPLLTSHTFVFKKLSK